MENDFGCPSWDFFERYAWLELSKIRFPWMIGLLKAPYALFLHAFKHSKWAHSAFPILIAFQPHRTAFSLTFGTASWPNSISLQVPHPKSTRISVKRLFLPQLVSHPAPHSDHIWSHIQYRYMNIFASVVPVSASWLKRVVDKTAYFERYLIDR